MLEQRDPFSGKKIVQVPVQEAIKNSEAVLARIQAMTAER